VADRVGLVNMRFEGRHGVLDQERTQAQPFEVDAELYLDLAPAGLADDLSLTVDYRDVFEICREVVEDRSVKLIEALAESIAARLLARFEALAVSEVVVRVRKPLVPLPGELDCAAVEVRRRPERRV
jgi:dihydroneopterin aldolase